MVVMRGQEASGYRSGESSKRRSIDSCVSVSAMHRISLLVVEHVSAL
jgi:hypothetical protein